VADGERVVIGGVLEHIEAAGIHSGDSAMVLPTYKIAPQHLDTIREYTRRMGVALQVKGLMNVQYAIKDDVVYVLEVNPRASRTVPFVAKVIGLPVAKIAAKKTNGKSIKKAKPGMAEPSSFPEIGPADILDSDIVGLNGSASFYGRGFQGRKTSTGERFDIKKFTAARNNSRLAREGT